MAKKKPAGTPSPAEINRRNAEFSEAVGQCVGDAPISTVARGFTPSYPRFSEPGKAALMSYRSHGSGIFLFMAYLERRSADKEAARALEKHLIEQMESSSLSPESFAHASAELLWLGILRELDPIIKDLVRFCEAPGPVDDQLPNLRSALKIERGHSPYEAELAEQRWEVEYRWIQAYLKMGEERQYRSQNDIAGEISQAVGISKSTAINYWRNRKKLEPWQAEWAKQIEGMARLAGQHSKKAKQPAVQTPRSTKNFTFGKKRANQ